MVHFLEKKALLLFTKKNICLNVFKVTPNLVSQYFIPANTQQEKKMPRSKIAFDVSKFNEWVFFLHQKNWKLLTHTLCFYPRPKESTWVCRTFCLNLGELFRKLLPTWLWENNTSGQCRSRIWTLSKQIISVFKAISVLF